MYTGDISALLQVLTANRQHQRGTPIFKTF